VHQHTVTRTGRCIAAPWSLNLRSPGGFTSPLSLPPSILSCLLSTSRFPLSFLGIYASGLTECSAVKAKGDVTVACKTALGGGNSLIPSVSICLSPLFPATPPSRPRLHPKPLRIASFSSRYLPYVSEDNFTLVCIFMATSVSLTVLPPSAMASFCKVKCSQQLPAPQTPFSFLCVARDGKSFCIS
jgi:hypothetical protein